MGVQSPRRRAGAERGYVLVMVLAALALITFVAGQFAERVDALRRQAATLQDYANARLMASDALAAMLFHVATEPAGADGFGLPPRKVVADGRPYAWAGGARVAVLDQRALLSLNVVDRAALGRLLEGLGASPLQRDTLVDVLLDYTDTDTLRRLNGAEAPEYERLGLLPPRNDWLGSVRELARMPHWREHPEWLVAMESLTSARRTNILNPNLMPLPVLAARLPAATPEQLALFDTLRKADPFVSGKAAQQATGLALSSEEFLFHTSDEVAIIAWAPGMPRALLVQLLFTRDDPRGPWQITEIHTVAPPGPAARDAPIAAIPPPLPAVQP